MKSDWKIILLTVSIVMCGVSTQAQFGGLKKMIPSGGGDDAASVDIGALQGDFNNNLLSLFSAKRQLIDAQMLYAEALGLKEQADLIKSAAQGLLEGGTAETSTENQEQLIKVSSELSDLLAANSDAVIELTDEQKQKYREGHIAFGKGAILYLGQAGAAVALGNQVIKDIEKVKSNPLNAPKAIALGVAAGKLTAMTISDSKYIIENFSIMRKIAKNNQIEVEEVELTLPDFPG